MTTPEKLIAALSECEHHANILTEARSAIGGEKFVPQSIEGIPSEKLRLLDQSAYRFGKLQDTLGLRVFPGLLDVSEELFPQHAGFGEKLQRLERLGALPSVQQWRTLRELRNQLAHEYVDAPALKAAALNRFIEGIDSLLEIWRQVSTYAESKGL